MKKILLLMCFAAITLQLNAQLNKNIIYAGLLQMGAGFADGTNQAYLFHYSSKFKNIKPNEIAWKNKWAKDEFGNVIVGKERFWGSSRWFVFTTDFHHATRFAENRLNEATGIVYSMEYVNIKWKGKPSFKVKQGKRFRKKWYWFAADFAVIFAARSAGFKIAYDGVFKR